MITRALDMGEFHLRMIKGLVSLILKEGDPKDLNYWRFITPLTVMYKIFPKAI